MKFEIKELKLFGGIWLFEKSDDSLISFGDIYLRKENIEKQSFCEQYDYSFEYHGIENALCGKEPNHKEEIFFTPKRILVIQMK